MSDEPADMERVIELLTKIEQAVRWLTMAVYWIAAGCLGWLIGRHL